MTGPNSKSSTRYYIDEDSEDSLARIKEVIDQIAELARVKPGTKRVTPLFCTEEGCGLRYKAKGKCQKHYQRAYWQTRKSNKGNDDE